MPSAAGSSASKSWADAIKEGEEYRARIDEDRRVKRERWEADCRIYDQKIEREEAAEGRSSGVRFYSQATDYSLVAANKIRREAQVSLQKIAGLDTLLKSFAKKVDESTR